jgi:hypothetical protein
MNIHKEPDMKTYIVEPDHGYALYLMKKNHEIFISVRYVIEHIPEPYHCNESLNKMSE